MGRTGGLEDMCRQEKGPGDGRPNPAPKAAAAGWTPELREQSLWRELWVLRGVFLGAPPQGVCQPLLGNYGRDGMEKMGWHRTSRRTDDHGWNDDTTFSGAKARGTKSSFQASEEMLCDRQAA